MSMGIIAGAVGVTGVVSAAGGLYGSMSQASAAKKAAKASAANKVAPVDLQEEQTKALDGNLANQKKINTLVSSTNSFNQSQATSMMESAIPGFSALQGKLMATTNDLLTSAGRSAPSGTAPKSCRPCICSRLSLRPKPNRNFTVAARC